MNHSEIMKFVLSFKFRFGFWVNKFFDMLPLRSGSVDPHSFADPDQRNQNLANPDPKHFRIRLKNNLEGIILENIAMAK